jgi:hypothetical protein
MGPKSNKFENSFQKKKKKEVVLKMDFPSLSEVIPNKKEEPPKDTSSSYRNMIKIEECKKELEEEKVGWIVLSEKGNEKRVKKIEPVVEENIMDQIIRSQEMMDMNHEKYRRQYIELYGEDEYNRNYTMTDSHLYDTSEEEEEEEIDIMIEDEYWKKSYDDK